MDTLSLLLAAWMTTALPAVQDLRPTDEHLETLIEAALSEDPIVESFEIVVTAVDGAVQLNGAVDTDDERARAGSVAADVEGVGEVDNRITVERSLVSADKSDAEIRREIEDEIENVDGSNNVEVHVDDGFVTLTGTVPSLEARRRATEIAFRAGAVLVKNQVRVKPTS